MEFTNVVDCGEPHFSKTFYRLLGQGHRKERNLPMVLWVSFWRNTGFFMAKTTQKTLGFAARKLDLQCHFGRKGSFYTTACRLLLRAAFCLFAARTNIVSQFSWVKGTTAVRQETYGFLLLCLLQALQTCTLKFLQREVGGKPR